MNAARSEVFTKILITWVYCSIALRNGWRRFKYIRFLEFCWAFCIVARDRCRSGKVVNSMSLSSFDVRPDLDLKFSSASSKLEVEIVGFAAIASGCEADT